MSVVDFDGVKVFSATLARDRAEIGEQITKWLAENRVKIVDRVVTQSSDHAYHCISITLFYRRAS